MASAADVEADARAARRVELRDELKRFEHSFKRKHGRGLETLDLTTDRSNLCKSVRAHVRSLYREYRKYRTDV